MEQEQRKPSKGFFIELARNLAQKHLYKESLTIAYYVTLSFFPILIIASTIIPFFTINLDIVTAYLEQVIPPPVLEYVLPYANNVLKTPQFGVLSISIVITFLSASQCLTYIHEGLNHVYSLEKARLYITTRIFSIFAFIAILLLLILLMLLFTFQDSIINTLVSSLSITDTTILYNFIKWGGTFGVLFAFFTLIYYMIPSVKQKIRNVFPGALISSALVLLTVNLFTLYLKFISYSLTAYGVISSFFVLLIWIRILAFIVLLGGLVNAMLLERKYGPPQIRESRFDNFFRRIAESAKTKVQSKK